MYHLIVSDLHLGAGNLLEDFLTWGMSRSGPADGERATAVATRNREFATFLARHFDLALRDGLTPHLLLLGDTFDLWQVQEDREPVREALLRILEAHAGVVAALRHWIGGGGVITLVVGNHDQPLVDAPAWELLAEILPGLNCLCDGIPVHSFTDEGAGLYVEHGHQWDPMNRIRSLANPNATCAGKRVVRAVVNRLEPLLPLIDKGADVGALLRELWRAGEGEGPRLWQEVAAHLIPILGRGCIAARHVAGSITSSTTPDFASVSTAALAAQERAFRRAVSPRMGSTTGKLPGNLRFIVSGHTHRLGHAETIVAGRRVIRINAGTWMPQVGEDGVVVQGTPAVVIAPDGKGGWKEVLHEFVSGTAP